MRTKLKIFLALEYLAFLIFFIYLYQYHITNISLTELIFFILVLFITVNISRFINTSSEITVSINLPILIPAMVLLGPFWTGIIALGATSISHIKNFIWYKFVFNRTMFFLAAGGAALIFKMTNNYFNSPYLIVPLLFASLTYFIINNGLVFTVVKIASGGEKDSLLVLYYIQLAKNLIFSYFLGLIFYYGYISIGKVFFILSIVLIYMLKDLLFSRIQQLNSFTQIVESFLKVIDSKDHYTEGHCERVARYTEILCKEMGLNRGKTERIVNMAKIHDIGKIYVDDSILKSSDFLTPEEYEEMKRHSEYGYQLLQDIDLLRRDLDIILYHHERYDGTGYPEGKKKKEIPLGARILSVCDALDVMVTGRSYKPALSKRQVLEELEECSGVQFDPKIAENMINIIKKGKFDDNFKEKERKRGLITILSRH
ncbi:MAG: hypothetical protein PWR10_2289 [Halanaerobiales bacterium]|nr:hypothetical protein [Halanaerobiales bacterium]